MPVAPPIPYRFTDDDFRAATAEIGPDHAPTVLALLWDARAWSVHREPILSALADVSHLPVGVGFVVGRGLALLREQPDQHTADGIALALAFVAEWAEKRAAHRTAGLAFAAVLAVMPHNARAVYHLGRVLRQSGALREAEPWLLHAVDVSAAAGDWRHHGLALSGMGNLMRERGNFPAATRYHRQALASARAHGVRRVEGDALYDLAVMAFERRQIPRGMEFARQAIDAYGTGHGQLVRLASDLAWVWMHQYGEAEHAYTVFTALDSHSHDPAFRAVLLANTARAAGEIGAEALYEVTWADAYAYLRRLPDDVGRAAALGQLALGALAMMQIERARQTAEMSRSVAAERGEHRLVHDAELILGALADGMPLPAQLKAVFPAFALSERRRSPARVDRDEDFAAALAAVVEERRDGAPLSPVGALLAGR